MLDSKLRVLAPALLSLTVACGDSGNDGGSDDVGETVDTGTGSGTNDGSEIGTTDMGTTDAGTTDMGTTDTGTSDTGMTDTGTTDTGTSDTGTTDTGTSDTSDTGTSETGNCLPFEIDCDGLDEDCDGIIDNVDAGMDGFCDCYKIGIIGNKGANPAANFEDWLIDKGTIAVRFGTAANHVLTDADLAEYDILIVDRLTHTYSPQEAALLNDWIQAGHGMISMAGYTNAQIDRDQQNSLVSQSGLSYELPLYLNPVEVWENHPIAQGATA
ncbi:MAG: hypothetical protein KC457_27375, partial [Myxococcales bacterium]|nr:hypothetical protein [Myxococcales bacterium]